MHAVIPWLSPDQSFLMTLSVKKRCLGSSVSFRWPFHDLFIPSETHLMLHPMKNLHCSHFLITKAHLRAVTHTPFTDHIVGVSAVTCSAGSWAPHAGFVSLPVWPIISWRWLLHYIIVLVLLTDYVPQQSARRLRWNRLLFRDQEGGLVSGHPPSLSMFISSWKHSVWRLWTCLDPVRWNIIYAR